MKRLLVGLGLALFSLMRPVLAAPHELDARLREPAFQYEVLRYVYLWYLDDRFFIVIEAGDPRYNPAATRTLLEQAGGKAIMYKTGHSLIKAKMKEIGSPFAGEMSGHFFFGERWYGVDDGIYAAARLLEILASAEAPPEAILDRVDAVTPEEVRSLAAETLCRDRFTLAAVGDLPDAALSF